MPLPREQSLKSASRYSRREFLEASTRNAAGIAAGAVSLGAARSPNERLQIGVIGLGLQGRELAFQLGAIGQSDIVAICDVDVKHLAIGQDEISRTQKHRPIAVTQHEQLLDRSDLDAVMIATPDHSHAVIAIDAFRAGKDVYLEMPVAHTIAETNLLTDAASESKRIVQVGLPQRSGKHFQSAVEVVRSGFLGQIHLAKGWAVHRRKSIGTASASNVPSGVDYDRWLGPAASIPFQSNRFHQNWPWFWAFGSGELGQWGVHQLDLICWALELGYPERVSASGGIRSLRDDRETPDTLSVHYAYPEVDVIWEHRQWSHRGIEGRSSGAAFYGELGTLIVDRSGWKVYDHHQDLYADATEIRKSSVADFVNSVRQRIQPAASLQVGQLSTTICHLGNIAYRLGREVRFNPQSRTFENDSAANEMLNA